MLIQFPQEQVFNQQLKARIRTLGVNGIKEHFGCTKSRGQTVFSFRHRERSGRRNAMCFWRLLELKKICLSESVEPVGSYRGDVKYTVSRTNISQC